MEQAVNTFSKGLNTDLHPMIQGKEVLTDALNATFVTMNDNEIVLQNDMGNRKVENAYLPEGFEPVGIKEYGGVIYIAAYNPTTNQSQIGSFPSPFKGVELTKEEEISSNIFGFKTFIEDGITFLQNDSNLILFYNDIIHIGDKFLITEQNYNYFKYLSNCDNVTYGKVNSPKNNWVTLKLGVLNSQNLFVDITPSLYRWDENGELITFKNKIDSYKNNAGFFIRRINNSNNAEIETIKDALVSNTRDAVLVNTYTNKIAGLLFLNSKLNHIEEFNYSIMGNKIDDKLKLFIVANIGYNCPDSDNSITINDKSNLEYVNLDELEGNNIKYIDFDFFHNQSFNMLDTSSYAINSASEIDHNQIDSSITIVTPPRPLHVPGYTLLDLIGESNINNETSVQKYGIYELLEQDSKSLKTKSIYNADSNLYKTTVTKTYTIDKKENSDDFGILDFYICPICYYPNPENNSLNKAYLYNLSTKGEINLDLLGTYKIVLDNWYYTYNNESVEIHYGIYNYSLSSEDVTIKAAIYNSIGSKILDDIDFCTFSPGNLYISDTYTISLEDYGLSELQMYYIELTYDSKKLDNVIWFITTDLLNDGNAINLTNLKQGNNFKEINYINVPINCGFSYTINSEETGGKYYSDKYEDLEYTRDYTYGITINSISIDNETKYPKFLQANLEDNISINKIEHDNNLENCTVDIKEQIIKIHNKAVAKAQNTTQVSVTAFNTLDTILNELDILKNYLTYINNTGLSTILFNGFNSTEHISKLFGDSSQTMFLINLQVSSSYKLFTASLDLEGNRLLKNPNKTPYNNSKQILLIRNKKSDNDDLYLYVIKTLIESKNELPDSIFGISNTKIWLKTSNNKKMYTANNWEKTNTLNTLLFNIFTSGEYNLPNNLPKFNFKNITDNYLDIQNKWITENIPSLENGSELDLANTGLLSSITNYNKIYFYKNNNWNNTIKGVEYDVNTKLFFANDSIYTDECFGFAINDIPKNILRIDDCGLFASNPYYYNNSNPVEACIIWKVLKVNEE